MYDLLPFFRSESLDNLTPLELVNRVVDEFLEPNRDFENLDTPSRNIGAFVEVNPKYKGVFFRDVTYLVINNFYPGIILYKQRGFRSNYWDFFDLYRECIDLRKELKSRYLPGTGPSIPAIHRLKRFINSVYGAVNHENSYLKISGDFHYTVVCTARGILGEIYHQLGGIYADTDEVFLKGHVSRKDIDVLVREHLPESISYRVEYHFNAMFLGKKRYLMGGKISGLRDGMVLIPQG